MINHTFVVCAYKESKFLEKCIDSLEKQTYKSNIIIVTSTPNGYINKVALNHNLKVIVNNGEKKGIGYDFDFALYTGSSQYVTIAHQDDLYEPDFSKKVIEAFKKSPNGIISFTDYHEEHDYGIVRKNRNLTIKRILLAPLKIKIFQRSIFIRRRMLSLGNCICCPSVTFNKKFVSTPLFANDFKSNIDWYAWEKLSRKNGSFIYISDDLMMHRIHEEATTTELIKENKRSNEDYEMFCCFWPKGISKMLTKFYCKSEDNIN